MKRPVLENWLLLALIVAGVLCRVAFRGVPNFAPVAAIALFAGYFTSSRWLAAAVPLAIMSISDLFIGGYAWQTMLVVYTLLTLPTLAGAWLRTREAGEDATSHSSSFLVTRLALLIGCSLTSSVLFYLCSNLAWWSTSAIYERSLAGLIHCYSQGLPFFRYTLTGDLFFAAVLFGGYSLAIALGWQSRAVAAKEWVGE